MRQNGPLPYQRRIIWKAATGLAILVLALLLITLIWAVSTSLAYLQPVLLPVAVAGVIAYLLEPIVSWMIKKGMSRLKSVLIVYTSFVILVIGMASVIIPPLVSQVTNEELHSKIGTRIQSTVESVSEKSWVKPIFSNLLAKHEDVVDKITPDTQEKSEKSIPTSENSTDSNNSTSSDTPVVPTIEALIDPDVDTKLKFSDTNLAKYLSNNAGKITAFTTKLITSSTSTFIGTLGLLIGLAMVPIYLYYFLKEGSAIKNNWHQYVPLKASIFKNEVVETLTEINGYLISFFRGQVLVAMIDGILVGIALAVFQLPYGVLIGLFLGIIGVIPFVGNILCLVPACFISYVHFSSPDVTTHQWLLGDNPWAYVGAVAGIFVVVQQINSLITAPKIVGESVGLHPMTVIFSMLFWSLILGGMLGALLAVPLTAAVKVLFRRYIWQKQIQKYSGEEELAFADKSVKSDKPNDLDEDDLEDGFLA